MEDSEKLLATEQENKNLESLLKKNNDKLQKALKDYEDLESWNQHLSDYSETQANDIQKQNNEILNHQTIIEAKDFELKRLKNDYSRQESLSVMSNLSTINKSGSTSIRSTVPKDAKGYFYKTNKEKIELQNEIKQLKNEIDNLLEENNTFRENFDALNNEFIKVTASNQESTREIEQYKSLVVKHKEDNVRLNIKIEKITGERQKLRESNEKLKYELEKANQNLVDYNKKGQVNQSKTDQNLNDLKNENQNMQILINGKNEQIFGKNDEIENLSQQLEISNQFLKKKDEEIMEFATNSAYFMEEYKKDALEYEKNTNELNEQIILLTNQLDYSTNENSKLNLNQNEIIKEQKNIIEKKDNEKEDLYLEKYNMSSIINDMGNKINSLNEQVSQKNEVIEKEQKSKAEIEHVLEITQKEASRNLEDLEKSRSDLNFSGQKISSLNLKISNLTEILQQDQSNLEQLQSNKNESDSSNKMYETRIDNLNEEISELRFSKRKYVDMYFEASEKAKTIEETSQKEISRLTNADNDWKNRYNDTLERLEMDYEHNVEESKQNIKQLTEKNQAKDLTITTNKRNLIAKAIEFENLQTEFKQYKLEKEKIIASKEEMIQDLEDELYKLSLDVNLSTPRSRIFSDPCSDDVKCNCDYDFENIKLEHLKKVEEYEAKIYELQKEIEFLKVTVKENGNFLQTRGSLDIKDLQKVKDDLKKISFKGSLKNAKTDRNFEKNASSESEIRADKFQFKHSYLTIGNFKKGQDNSIFSKQGKEKSQTRSYKLQQTSDPTRFNNKSMVSLEEDANLKREMQYTSSTKYLRSLKDTPVNNNKHKTTSSRDMKKKSLNNSLSLKKTESLKCATLRSEDSDQKKEVIIGSPKVHDRSDTSINLKQSDIPILKSPLKKLLSGKIFETIVKPIEIIVEEDFLGSKIVDPKSSEPRQRNIEGLKINFIDTGNYYQDKRVKYSPVFKSRETKKDKQGYVFQKEKSDSLHFVNKLKSRENSNKSFKCCKQSTSSKDIYSSLKHLSDNKRKDYSKERNSAKKFINTYKKLDDSKENSSTKKNLLINQPLDTSQILNMTTKRLEFGQQRTKVTDPLSPEKKLLYPIKQASVDRNSPTKKYDNNSQKSDSRERLSVMKNFKGSYYNNDYLKSFKNFHTKKP